VHHIALNTYENALPNGWRMSHAAGRVQGGLSTPTHLLQAGCGIRTIQELLGHKDVRTTMIYPHACTERSEYVFQRGGQAVRSPLDL